MTRYRLAPARPTAADAPDLDSAQRTVVEHADGPMLVLAGPGTGKTTTLVEAVVEAIDGRGVSPESVLVLTFSRKAAEQLRERIAARLGRTLSTPLASTFHSFAYGLLRSHTPADLFDAPLRLLSAPEQDVAVRTLLEDTPESVAWPAALRLARGTQGFAAEVSDLLARARERGVGAEELARLGHQHGRESWVAAAAFLEQYLDVLDALGAVDYADLISRAVTLLEQPDVTAELRGRFSHVFVDEYQDTDPSQVNLLQALAGDGRHLVVVGDPDQSIYGFRGADLRGILDFPTQFRTAAGHPAPVVSLDVTRRFGPGLLAASRRLAAGLPTAGAIPVAEFERFRNPESQVAEPGLVAVRTYDTERAEIEHIADALRRAHLESGVPWSEMAVLVRSATRSIPLAKRALLAAGVPVVVAEDETPLTEEPAVQSLLAALEAAVALGAGESWEEPGSAVELLMSPLGGMDATSVRRVARELRRRDVRRAAAEGRVPRPSDELLAAAVLDPTQLQGVPGPEAAQVAALSGLLRRAADAIDSGVTAEEVLWELWSGTPWPDRLRDRALNGDSWFSTAAAHRDLDAICALFDEAARVEGRRGHTAVRTFLETLAAQTIPADSLADRGVQQDGVRLMTAHRSKGLEWRVVVVAHVQDGLWPDLRQRSTLLRAGELGRGEVLPPLTSRALLAEERRLFYVACTRARERLLVTAVASADDNGEQPSRFLSDLVDEVVHVRGRPPRPLSLPALVAELRRTVDDPVQPTALREAAALRLARLCEVEHRGRPLVPAAHPDRWWGLAAPTVADTPLLAPGEIPSLTASDMNALKECPAKWFFESRAGGRSLGTAAQGFGTLVHALAERIGRGELSGDEDLSSYLDRVWPALVFDTPWGSAAEREEAEAALARFLAWHGDEKRDRSVLALEPRLRATVTLPDGVQVEIRGFADRLEIDSEGRVVTVDLKTNRSVPTKAAAQEHPQLGLYQLAVEHGAADALLGRPAEPGGAELVQLRHEAYGSVKVLSQQPQSPDDEGWRLIERQLAEAVTVVRAEEFPATPGDQCRYCAFADLCPAQGKGTVLR